MPLPGDAGQATARRLLGWIVLGFALAAVGAGIAEYLVAQSARVWVANGAWLTSSLVAVVGVAAALRSSAPQERPGWALLLYGCASWTIGELLWITFGLTDYPASPNLADLCWLALAIFATLSVIRLGAAARGRG